MGEWAERDVGFAHQEIEDNITITKAKGIKKYVILCGECASEIDDCEKCGVWFEDGDILKCVDSNHYCVGCDVNG